MDTLHFIYTIHSISIICWLHLCRGVGTDGHQFKEMRLENMFITHTHTAVSCSVFSPVVFLFSWLRLPHTHTHTHLQAVIRTFELRRA